MNLAQKIERLHNSEQKLLLIVGGPGSGKSKAIREYSNETGIPMLDLDMIFQHTPTDKLVEENLTDEVAIIKVKEYNENNKHSDWFAKAVSDDYKLWGGMAELV